MEKKESSVDYFFEEVVKWETRPWLYASEDGLEGIREKAKAMHKEEIEQAYGHGLNNGYMDAMQKNIIVSREQYYNKTFKGEQ